MVQVREQPERSRTRRIDGGFMAQNPVVQSRFGHDNNPSLNIAVPYQKNNTQLAFVANWVLAKIVVKSRHRADAAYLTGDALFAK